MLEVSNGKTIVAFSIHPYWVSLPLDLYLFYVSRAETMYEVNRLILEDIRHIKHRRLDNMQAKAATRG